MMNHEVYIHYAHCTKLTPGSPDCYPWSEYELRTVKVGVETVEADADYDKTDYRVTYQGKVLACEESLDCALGLAEYTLMDRSRTHVANRPPE